VRKENLGQVEQPDGEALWVCRENCITARKDCFEVAERFEIQIHSGPCAPLLEATISMKEQLWSQEHSIQILHMDRLNDMSRCTIEREVRESCNFENCVSHFAQMTYHEVKDASNSLNFKCEAIPMIY
jgi:hypothetical protein